MEWVTLPFSRRSSQPRYQTQVSHIAGGFFTSWATREEILIKSLNFDCDYIQSRLILSLSILEINQYWIFQCVNMIYLSIYFSSVQFSSVTQSCPTLCNPMNHSMPRLPVHHQLLEFTQTHIHWVGDAIQPSYPLSSPSPPAPNPSQHQGLFQWVNSSHEVAKVLDFQLQVQSFQWTLRTDLLQDGRVGSPCSPRDSQESSPTPQFKSINSLVFSFLPSPTLTSIHDYWKNHSLD